MHAAAAAFQRCVKSLTPAVLLHTLAYFALTNTLSAINIWTPQILQVSTPAAATLGDHSLAAIPQFCTILGMIWWSRRSDKLKERKAHHPAAFARRDGMLASATDHSLIQLLWHHHGLNRSFTAMAIFWTTPIRLLACSPPCGGAGGDQRHRQRRSAVSPLLIGILRDATGSFSSGAVVRRRAAGGGRVVLTRIPNDPPDSLGRDPGMAGTEDPLRRSYVPEPRRQYRYQQRVRRKFKWGTDDALSVVRPHGGFLAKTCRRIVTTSIFRCTF